MTNRFAGCCSLLSEGAVGFPLARNYVAATLPRGSDEPAQDHMQNRSTLPQRYATGVERRNNRPPLTETSWIFRQLGQEEKAGSVFDLVIFQKAPRVEKAWDLMGCGVFFVERPVFRVWLTPPITKLCGEALSLPVDMYVDTATRSAAHPPENMYLNPRPRKARAPHHNAG